MIKKSTIIKILILILIQMLLLSCDNTLSKFLDIEGPIVTISVEGDDNGYIEYTLPADYQFNGIIISAKLSDPDGIDQSIVPTISLGRSSDGGPITDENVIWIKRNVTMSKISDLIWEYEFPDGEINDGPVTLKVKAFDIAGNESSLMLGKTSLIVDNRAPVAGNSGLITTTDVYAETMTLNWTSGNDTNTAANDLEYCVYRSTTNNIEEWIYHDNGIQLADWTRGMNTFDVSGQSGSTSYYYNVFVKDHRGHISNYTMKNQTTATYQEIRINQGATNIPGNDSYEYDFGLYRNVYRTFSISNDGGSPLILSAADPIDVSGTDASNFIVTTPPDKSEIPPGDSTDFIIYFTAPLTRDYKFATVTIDNNDQDEGSFIFDIKGLAS